VFITYKQVRDYVQNAPAGHIVGICQSPTACIVAEATMAKYPDYDVEVTLEDEEIHIRATRILPYWETVTTGDDGVRLLVLAQRFDDLSWGSEDEERPVTREEALELFSYA
jgi:hypothetical protein